jgi:ribosomal protein S18 acetylase RimI-like enzyme
MICKDLQTVPAVALPGDLTLRPVRRLADDAPGGVPLTRAVAAASLADPAITDPRALADYLRSLPRAFGLWVAIDDGGMVRATSGSAAFGATASVIFVNTDPDWRRRGIARAMTTIALRAAEQAGARHAGLDASTAGRELYLGLGFEAATPVTRFRSSP